MGGLATHGAGHLAAGRADRQPAEDPVLDDEGAAVRPAAVHPVLRLVLLPLRDVLLDDGGAQQDCPLLGERQLEAAHCWPPGIHDAQAESAGSVATVQFGSVRLWPGLAAEAALFH